MKKLMALMTDYNIWFNKDYFLDREGYEVVVNFSRLNKKITLFKLRNLLLTEGNIFIFWNNVYCYCIFIWSPCGSTGSLVITLLLKQSLCTNKEVHVNIECVCVSQMYR